MKEETASLVIDEFVRLKPNMHFYIFFYTSEHKKEKRANKRAAATTSHSECQGVFLNDKCLKASLNRIQNKCHKKGTYFIYALITKYIS